VIEELDVVVLRRDLAEHGLQTGDLGAVVMVYDGGVAYEVEFVLRDGRTAALLTLRPEDISPRGIAPARERPFGRTALLHVDQEAVAPRTGTPSGEGEAR
jgi:hypothetical protein